MTVKKGESDRESRLRNAMGFSKTPEEARLKRCSHFTLDLDVGDGEDNEDNDVVKTAMANAGATCSLILEQREKQLDDCADEIKLVLQDAVDQVAVL